MSNASFLASEYSRLSNQAAKGYRALSKKHGLKGKGNPGCGSKSFSDYEMKPENTSFVAEHICQPGMRQFYTKLEDPVHLLFGLFGGVSACITPSAAFESILAEFQAVHNAAQTEWDSIYS